MFGLERVFDGCRIGTSTEITDILISDKNELYRKVLSTDSNNSICRKCTKTVILRKYDECSFSDIYMGEDLLRSLPIYKYSNNIVFIHNVLYSYVMNNESMVHSVTPKNFQPSYILYKNVIVFLSSEGIEDYECRFEIRTLYAQKLIRDVLQIARFKCAFKEKIKILEDVITNSIDILSGPIDEKLLGRRRLIFSALKKRQLCCALEMAYVENKINELSIKTRRLVK